MRDGLPLNGISSVLLGPDGYLWVATFGGVVRFDGVRFSPVLPSAGPGWPSPRAAELRASPDGRVWVLLEQGWVVAVDPATDALRVFEGERLKIGPDGAVWTVSRGAVRRLGWDGPVPFDAPALAGQQVVDVEPVPDGGLWAVSSDAAILVRADGSSRALSIASLQTGAPVRLLTSEDGAVWVTGDRALARLPGNAAEEAFVLRVGGAPWGAEAVGVALEPDGALLVGTEQDLSLWQDGQARPLLDDRPGRPPFRSQVLGSDGARWVATRHAVLRDGAVVFRTDPGDGVTSIATDADGALWVGTRRSGLHQIQPALLGSIGLKDGLRGDNVYALAEARDGLWIGGSDLYLSRWSNGRLDTFGASAGLPEDIGALLEDDQGVLWVGTRDGGLLRSAEPARDRFVPVADSGAVAVRALHQRANGDLLVGSGSGLWRQHAGRWASMDESWGLPDAEVRTIGEGSDGALWLGTNGDGVVRVQGETSELWSAADGGSDLVRSLLPVEGGVWVGTEDQGMIFFDREGPGRARLGPEQGLPDTTVHALVADGAGAIWGNTNKGLFRLDARSLAAFAAGGPAPAVDRFAELDGLPDREGNGGNNHAGLRARDGTIAFANQRGVVLVDPGRRARTSAPLRLRVEGLTAGEQRYSGAGPIVLAPEQRTFDLAYTALSFRAPERVRFQHRLLGLESAWVNAEDRRRAHYSAVPPGAYTFELRATDADGLPSAATETLAIVVQPTSPRPWPFAWACCCWSRAPSAARGWRGSARRAVERPSSPPWSPSRPPSSRGTTPRSRSPARSCAPRPSASPRSTGSRPSTSRTSATSCAPR